MENMRILIRIVFVIFIANEIVCLGGVCDDCCDCFKEKKEYEEIKEEGKNTAKSLVNDAWYNAQKNNPVLKIFKKKGNNDFPSKDNGDKILIKSEKKGNPKIVYLQKKEDEDPLNLGGKKYALFEIKPNGGNTVYLYCSDVESSRNFKGIFSYKDHKSISVIACDTTNVTNMNTMFFKCSSLKNLDISNFNTTKVTNMRSMFSFCMNLTKLDLKNFNTSNVTDMGYMFCGCSSLTKLDLKNFDTTNVTRKENMFYRCDNLHNDIKNKFSNKK